jgi:hypothetical protein
MRFKGQLGLLLHVHGHLFKVRARMLVKILLLGILILALWRGEGKTPILGLFRGHSGECSVRDLDSLLDRNVPKILRREGGELIACKTLQGCLLKLLEAVKFHLGEEGGSDMRHDLLADLLTKRIMAINVVRIEEASSVLRFIDESLECCLGVILITGQADQEGLLVSLAPFMALEEVEEEVLFPRH